MGQDLSIPHLAPSPAPMASVYKARGEELKQRFAMERSLPPEKQTSFPDPKALIADFEFRSSRVEAVSSFMGSLTEKGTHAGGVKHTSKTPLEQLKRIELRSMMLRKQHTGRYMLARVVTRICKNVGITFVGQEPGGNVFNIALYTSPWGFVASNAEIDAILPLGSVIAIREPFLKAAGDGTIVVRVDSHTDLVFLDEDRDLVGLEWKNPVLRPDQRPPKQTAEQHKTRGNALLAKKWYLPAERAYSDGLKEDPSSIALRLNRALVRLKLGLWRSALGDAQAVLDGDRSALSHASLEKALYRAALAEYALQLWPASRTHFEELVAIESDEGAKGLKRVVERIKESETGQYDWWTLYSASQKDPNVDLADYTSPSIRVSDLKGKGRGLVATKAVKAGELLLMAKPFASCYAHECQKLFSCNLHSGAIESTTHAHLSQRIAIRLMDDPSLAEVFDLLYAGPTRPQPPSFSLAKLKKPKALPNPQPVDVDMEQIELVRTYNAATVSRLSAVLQPSPDDDREGWSEETSQRPAALYVVPSLINHSCCPTAVCGFLGDAVFIRAGRDLKEGEEVTISYTPGLGFDARTETLSRFGISRCKCQLCTEDRKDSKADRARRRTLIAAYQKLPPPPTQKSTPAEDRRLEALYQERVQLVKEIEKTYAAGHDPQYRPEIWPCYHNLADITALLSRNSDEIPGLLGWAYETRRWHELILSSSGASCTDAEQATYRMPYEHRELCALSMLHMATTLDVMKDMLGGAEGALTIQTLYALREGKGSLNAPFLKRAEQFDAVFVGGGRRVFLERYKGYLQRYGLKAADFA